MVIVALSAGAAAVALPAVPSANGGSSALSSSSSSLSTEAQKTLPMEPAAKKSPQAPHLNALAGTGPPKLQQQQQQQGKEVQAIDKPQLKQGVPVLTSEKMEAAANSQVSAEDTAPPQQAGQDKGGKEVSTAGNATTEGGSGSSGKNTEQQSGGETAEELIDIAVVIPTVRRYTHEGQLAPEKYLGPLVHKLWDDLNDKEKAHVKFLILNSDKEPEKHEEAVELQSIPSVSLFTKEAEQKRQEEETLHKISSYSELEDGRSVSSQWLTWVASENLDGAFLFEKAKMQAPYVLFLEDDVTPSSQALRKLSHFVRNFEREHTTDWLFIDLYTPNLDWAEGMLDVKHGEKYKFQCCTQAMLFRSNELDGVIGYWLEHSREPVDDNLREYLKNVRPDLSVFAVRPNLFEHVGAFSSNAEKSTGVVEHRSLDFVPLLI